MIDPTPMLTEIDFLNSKISDLHVENVKLRQLISDLKEDGEKWFDNACAFMPASSMPKLSIQGQAHTALMEKIEKEVKL